MQIREFNLKFRFDDFIDRLLNAGGYLKLKADVWLKLCVAHLNSCVCFACWFRKLLLAGFDALSGDSHARAPELSASRLFHNEQNRSRNKQLGRRRCGIRLLKKKAIAILMPDVRQERHWVLGMANKNWTSTRILATTFAAIAAQASSQSCN